MKKFFSLIVLFVLPFACFAQLKSKVCVVREVFYEQTKEDMQEFADDFARHGETDMANALEKYLDGGSFGTGFVYVAPDGKNYIITNRHVVEQAKTCNIEFVNPDDSVSKYEGLTILAVSQDIDLAILAFPPDVQPFQEGLPFYAGPINDGDLVYTAGFPAFDGEPSWQLGTGNVTNSNAKISKLINPDITKLIQHSAQVDPGNSGGPLLRKTKNGEFVVVGVNTWKALNRQAANFSLPALVVQDFIRTSLTRSNYKDPLTAVDERAAAFEEIVADWEAEYEDIVPYISMDFVADYGKQIFNEVLKKASANTKKTIVNEFFYESPIAGFRYAIAWYVFFEYHKNDKSKANPEDGIILQGYEIPEGQEDSDTIEVIYYLPGTKKIVRAEWINENGIWQLYSFKYGKNTKSKAKPEKKKKQKKVEEDTVDVSESINEAEEAVSDEESDIDGEDSEDGKPKKKAKKAKKEKVDLSFNSENLYTFPGKFTVLMGMTGTFDKNFSFNNFNDYLKKDFLEKLGMEFKVNNIFEVTFQIKMRNQLAEASLDDPIKGVQFLLGGQLQVPFNFGKIGLMPYGNLNTGIHILHPYSISEGFDFYIPAVCEVGLRTFLNTAEGGAYFIDIGGLYEINMNPKKKGQYFFHDMGYKWFIDFGLRF